MAVYLNSYETWWFIFLRLIDFSTYKYLLRLPGIAIAHTNPFVSSMLWWFEMADVWLCKMTMTFTFLLGKWISYELSNLWTTILLEMEFLKKLHRFWKDDWIWRDPIPRNGYRFGTRPSPAERKAYGPGLSRRSYFQMDDSFYYVPGAPDNRFRSALRTKRWDSPKTNESLRSKQSPLSDWFERRIQDLWPDSNISAQICEEINQILASLWLMIGFRFLSFVGFCSFELVAKALEANGVFLTFLAESYLKLRYWKTFRAGPKVWIRIRTRKKHREKASKRWSRTMFVLATVYNIDEKVSMAHDNPVQFDCDSNFAICDNAANTHICNDKRMFTELNPFTDKQHVVTIGGKQNLPSGIGTVKWTWTDDKGNPHTHFLPNVLYFPTSPVNILSVEELANYFDDDDGTGIDSKRKVSRLYWDHNKYERTFQHSASNLPELPINEGTSSFAWFTRACARKFNDCIDKTCCLTNRHLDQLSEKHASGLGNEIFLESLILPGEHMIYKKEGKNSMIRIISCHLNHEGVLVYKIRFPEGHEQDVPREFLHRPGNPEICDLPRTTVEYRDTANLLSEEEIRSISHPQQLSPLQQEFLNMHHRLFHLPYTVMFRLAQIGILPNYFLRIQKNPPPCASCLFGTAHRRPWRTKKAKDREQATLKPATIQKAGDCVSVDQMVSAQPGLLPQAKGQLTRARVWGCTVFVDHATDYTCIVLMRDFTAESTMAAKYEFEQKCKVRGITVKRYHADNGRFAEPAFIKDCESKGQKLTFCGVGAHHQNGIVERRIKEITLGSRTLLLHAIRYWPEYMTTMLWPFAVKCTEDRLNNLTINKQGNTPEMSFSGTQAVHVQAQNYHPFGCPCYVLDSRAQTDSKNLPKWEPRARLAIYVGHSPAHAGSVAMVLNPKTGLVSPQFHVVFDDNFSTVPHMRNGTIPSNWEDLVRNSTVLETDKDYDLTRTWFNGDRDESANEDSSPGTDSVSSNPSQIRQQIISLHDSDNQGASPANEGASPILGSLPIPSPNEGAPPDPSPVSEGDDSLRMPPMANLRESGLRRSPRLQQKRGILVTILTAAFSSTLVPDTIYGVTNGVSQAIEQMNSDIITIDRNFDGTFNSFMTHAFAAGKESNEVYTFREMLKQEDRLDFVNAMEKEIDDHVRREHWEIIPRSMMPQDMKTIMSIWSFKRKRLPDGTLNKHKARLCAHGGMQQWGVNYWETYAPVVNWISVRFLLIISEILGLETKALDFVLAFPQADLDTPVYMEIPIGVAIDGIDQNRHYVLRLRKSLYGLKQASNNWYSCLKDALENRGFKESLADPCVFMKANMVILVYVDDCILIAKGSDIIKDFIDSLTHGPEKFEFTDEGTMDKYLGVDIQKLDNGEFVLRQPFLIQRILTSLGIDPEETNSRPVPVVGPLLSRDTDGPDRKHDWHYRSAIGMLGYLQNSTRPDISMAVHQCARFNANPKLCHEKAVKRIARYLLGTADKGLKYGPDPNRGLECYVDADFAGGWSSGDHTNPECVLSRTGFVIMYAGCPVTWSSKLQTEIALSTTEAEYIALSQAMREVIPFMNLMQEIDNIFGIHNPSPQFHCRVFEDNRSCIKVAESPKFTPRTKHIAIKYHHFRSFVSDGTIKIKHIDTKEQIADMLTKPLEEGTFKYLRRQLMGW